MRKKEIFFQKKKDFSEILPLRIVKLIFLLFNSKIIFGHISDSKKMVLSGFHLFKNFRYKVNINWRID